LIYGKVGRVGHGKTMRMVVEACELAKRRGAILASNIMITPPVGVDFRLLGMDDFSDALGRLTDECQATKRGLVLAVDEVHMIWDARRWDEMSVYDRYRLTQSRHLGIDVIWTAQFVDQVEKNLRNLTEEVELMRAYPSPTLARRERGKRPFVMVGQVFRPAAVRELVAEQDRDKRMARHIYRYRRDHELLYDTDALMPPPRVTSRRRAASWSSETAQGAPLAGPGPVKGSLAGSGDRVRLVPTK